MPPLIPKTAEPGQKRLITLGGSFKRSLKKRLAISVPILQTHFAVFTISERESIFKIFLKSDT
jgi:hypothetical protein